MINTIHIQPLDYALPIWKHY